MDAQHALITGGAGFIGSHIAEHLLREGVCVTVVDNLSVGRRSNVPEGARFVLGDVRDSGLMRELARTASVVFHQAAKVSIRASFDQCYEDAETNLMGTINVLQACSGSAVKKFVFASSMAVYADSPAPVPVAESGPTAPIAPYGVAKLAAERYCLMMCEHSGIDCVVLRYFNTFGPRQTFTPYVGVITIFINRLLEGKPPVIFGDGKQIRDFVYVGDIARANVLAMRSDARGVIMNIGTGTGTTVRRVAGLVCSRIDPSIAPEAGPEQAGELKISFADITRARSAIGYAPQHTLEQKIDEVIEYIRQQRR